MRESSNRRSGRWRAAAAGLVGGGIVLGGGGVAAGQVVTSEVEPNTSKATATVVVNMMTGDSLTGVTTGGSTSPGPTSADYFLIQTPRQSEPGVYRHRLTLTSTTPGHSVTLRGLNQVAAVAGAWPCLGPGQAGALGTTDMTAQTSMILGTARVVQWYGLGHGERMYLRVNGTTTTTAPYVATMETVAVPIVEVGTFAAGEITITTVAQGHTTDTDFWVLDADRRPIPGYGNDDNSVAGGGPGTGLAGVLRRPYQPGVYHLAIANWELVLREPAACDDRNRVGLLLDWPDTVLNNSFTLNRDVTFTISDAAGHEVQTPAVREGTFDVLFFRFTVTGDEPADCNQNGIDDALEIAGNPALDCYNPSVLAEPHVMGGPDGILDECQCPGNWDRDNAVNSGDVSAFVTSWLASVAAGDTSADFDCSGSVTSGDISAFVSTWLTLLGGPAPLANCP